MKIKSASGLTYHVKNLNKTAKFYETLGFDIRKRESNHITAYSNWFWIDFLAIGKDERTKSEDGIESTDRGAGICLYLSVENVDEFHKYLISQKLKPSTSPEDQPWGNREFLIQDPDGYKLVIFKRK